ncbi:hypothetical protein FD04_GL000971 [Secundilactobacillus odoratitofui DSM 19909 = JCM 15043]|uniref:Uncharacterized protein n=1 Tax=Secundilactobacillus odoratitofui DSM 19909 = JCM 15043 TaxID=1423776 RepID=A0A0R1LZV0_9LACO|nr:hypothetical protein [Secundilactobacillus odoratitofui]KRK97994.1 hypothetical protein FD04_GL000971 [Secundilactobacillus odoratitofui DSM 19909 = JCM 15043]
MSNQVSAIKKISSQLNDRYRQFLELDTLPSHMPLAQLDYFLTQAMSRHYHVKLHLAGQDAPTMSGYLSKGPKDTYLVSAPHQKLTQLAHLNQINFVERVDYLPY